MIFYLVLYRFIKNWGQKIQYLSWFLPILKRKKAAGSKPAALKMLSLYYPFPVVLYWEEYGSINPIVIHNLCEAIGLIAFYITVLLFVSNYNIYIYASRFKWYNMGKIK